VSSLIAQGTEFPLRKPAGFHWDLFLLGLTTGVAGLLGLPFPNGLIPQAPFHTASLCVTAKRSSVTDGNIVRNGSAIAAAADEGHPSEGPVYVSVVEQRVSNLAQGLLTLGTMSGPLLIILHLIPQGVLAGLFFIMGMQALAANGITAKLLFLARDRHLTSREHSLRQVSRRRAIWSFVAVELVAFAITFAITQTVAAVGFPVCILLLIPIRAILLPRWFDAQELALLDGPTAGPLAMQSVGGNSHEAEKVLRRAPTAGIGGNVPYSGETTAAASEVLLDGMTAQELAELGENRKAQQRSAPLLQQRPEGSDSMARRRTSTLAREKAKDGLHS
jgi:boron transporter